MKRLQTILSTLEPENKEVLWLHKKDGYYVIEYYGEEGWNTLGNPFAEEVGKTIEERVNTLEVELRKKTKGFTKLSAGGKSVDSKDYYECNFYSGDGSISVLAEFPNKINIQLSSTFINGVLESVEALRKNIVDTTNDLNQKIAKLQEQLDNDYTDIYDVINSLGSVYNVQGSKETLSDLLAIPSAKKGDVYSIEQSFNLNGKYYAEGTNVVCIRTFTSGNKASYWDAIGGTFKQSLYLKKADAAIVNPNDTIEGIERTDLVTFTEKDSYFKENTVILPFKLISKTVLTNGDIAWYRLAFSYPTGSSNSTHQILFQGAYTNKTSQPVESDWVTIDYVNNINLKDIGSVKQSINSLIKNLQDNYLNKEEVQDEITKQLDEIGPTGGGISGLLNLKDATAVRAAQDSITKNGESKTYIITDHDGNYPSPNIPLIYLDDMAQLRDLLYRGNDKALAYLLDTKEAYYQYGGTWYSQNIAGQVKLPTFNLTTARVGDLVTLIRYEFTADEFYNKYINFSEISNDNLLFKAYKVAQGYGDKTDGEFIQYLIRSGAIYSCPNNPEEDSSVTPVPLAVNEKVVLYTAQITPNTQNVYSGEFWSGNINAPGIYCYVTSGRPAGVPSGENFIGVVSPDGTKMLYSMKNPNNIFILESGNWRRIGVGKNTGGTGEVFNDYAGNFAHSDHAHAEGQKCRAESYNAHAEGYRTNARGNGSHAEGNSDGFDTHNEAIGMGSHVEGGGTQAVSDYAHAEGTCNVGIVDAIHEVGIGSNEAHKNAHTIMKDGKHFVYGIGGYDGTNHGQAKDLATIISSWGSIIDKGTLNEGQIRSLCESYETGIFSFIDGEKNLSCLLFKPYQPTGDYEFMCITHSEDGELNIAVRGGDGGGHGGWQTITETNIIPDSTKPISSGAVYNAIYSVLNTEV